MAEPAARPWRIGALVDLPDTQGISREYVEAVQLALDLSHEEGHLDRPAEVITREAWASPWDDTHQLRKAYRQLVDEEGVLAVAGPMTTDNSLSLLPLIEDSRVPTISICGASDFAGAFAFSLPNGGLAEEPIVMCSWLAEQGYGTIAVLREQPSRVADEYTTYLRSAAASLGLSVVAEDGVSAVAGVDVVTEALRTLQRSEAEVLAYLGFGTLFRELNPALEAIGWFPTRITNTVFVGAVCSPAFARHLEGWVGVEQYDERNRVFAAGLEAWTARSGTPTPSSVTSCAYDTGRCLAIGLERMAYPAPEALRDALETIRRLPAATGAPDTTITFGYRDHRGFKGAHYLVLRRAEGGDTFFVGTGAVGN